MTLTTGTYNPRRSQQSGGSHFQALPHSYLLAILLFLFCIPSIAQTFSATPLNDFQAGQLYLGAFAGFLYENSNTMPSEHDVEGIAAATRVQPLDASGIPDSNGKIVVVGMGFSNWTFELCNSYQTGSCGTRTFLAVSAQSSPVNHSSLVIVDCAVPGEVANRWLDDSFGNYTHCLSQLQAAGVTEAQVQVVLYKNGHKFPKQSLTSTTVCSAASTVDACALERDIATTARYLKTRYSNVQQLFLHSRIYGGYAASGTLNPEPFAYESGFAVKWLIEAQIQQNRTGLIDPTAGDVGYSAVPWMAWGPYFWASGTIPRSDGLTWLAGDYRASDMTHPGAKAIAKTSRMLVQFYLTSPYTPWYRAEN
jgi:hypothetical protein